MKKYILWALCCTVFNLAQAQQSYKKAYKKAYAFTHNNTDSAMVWAEKSIDLAKNDEEKYEAHYLRGFNAYKIGMYGQAVYDYTQSRSFASDQTTYFRINNNLADTYLNMGKIKKAIRLNQQSIDYNKQNKEWDNLSYAYEVKSNILRKQKDKTALEVLRKALYLRKKHTPQQIGYAYETIAIAFAAFSMPDSAIKYQRLTLEHYPIKSPNHLATLHTQLAKYLMQNKQLAKALDHLDKAKELKKTPMTRFFWNHTFGLYFLGTNAHAEARKVFDRCEVLYNRMLAQATDVVTRRTIYECGKELFRNFRQLKNLKAMEYELYGARLELAEVSLASDNDRIKGRDEFAKQNREEKKVLDSIARTRDSVRKIRAAQKTKQENTQPQKSRYYYIEYWLFYLGLAIIATWGIVQISRILKTTKIIEKEVPKIIEKEVPKIIDEEVPKIIEKETPKIIDEKVPKIIDEKVPKIIDEKVPKIIDEKVPKIIDEKVPKIIEKETPKIIDEKVPKIIDEKVPKIIDEKVPKIIEKKVPPIIDEKVPEMIIEGLSPLPLSKQDAVIETILLETLGFDLNEKPENEERFPETQIDKRSIVLKYYRGMSYRQIGLRIGKSAVHVKKHLDKLTQGTAYDSFANFINAFRAEHKKPEKPDTEE